MPSLINRLPGGLLSLLGIKSVGLNPQILADSVQPTIDLGRFYEAYGSQVVTGANGSASGIGVFYASEWWNQVSNNEVWAVQSVCIALAGYAALPAATTYRARVAIFNPNNGVVVQGAPEALTFTTGETPLWTLSPDAVILVPPGFALGLFVNAATLGTAQVFQTFGRVTKLAI